MREFTNKKLYIVGEKIFVDITGPFTSSLAGVNCWIQIVNNASKMGFCYFLRNKLI